MKYIVLFLLRTSSALQEAIFQSKYYHQESVHTATMPVPTLYVLFILSDLLDVNYSGTSLR